MRKFAMFVLAGAALLAAPQAMAADKYGTAGCGLGSMAFGNQAGAIQIVAATLNGLLGNQTFAITTGTSNCADTAGGVASTRAFIETNREALAKDISRGQGETVKNLSTLAGCSDSAAVGATLQKSFSAIFPAKTVKTDDVSDAIVSTLRSQKSLGCAKLG
jgi:hypothetical protein